MRRIATRNRGCESGITIDYLQNLQKAYDVFIMEISRLIPVIKVNYEQFRTADEMAAAIADKYMSLGRIQHVFYEGDHKGDRENVRPPTNLLLDLCQAEEGATTPARKQKTASGSTQTNATQEKAEGADKKKSRRRGRRKKGATTP